ncbi:uncharacterized protein BXIN_3091 [Babesia sp. Xinjiang]|uniref:uncharacterized protein n=1 Tax=Babesia sp. Xinjiang TaxID=462227 RepID=UPI000A242AA2|nr:uncharacterized protein BXIN_3091 [Babesia sp. Xinjiang]ORM39527.1 hypothetical protein BXIN_3091 [Babesia sp. Xinjiang]
MTSRMYAGDGRQVTSQQRRQDQSNDDVFLLDLEGKIDTLKNVSTDIHSELKNSTTRLDTLRGGLDEAQGYVKQGFDNMSKIMHNKTLVYEYADRGPIHVEDGVPNCGSAVRVVRGHKNCTEKEDRMTGEICRPGMEMGRPNRSTQSIGSRARLMARQGVTNDVQWNAVIASATETIASLTPLDIALLVNALTKVGKADAHLYTMIKDRIIHLIAFFSSGHLAMIMSAYAKAELMDDTLYQCLKAEIDRRMYEFITPTELCMVLNAVAKCKERDNAFLEKLAGHIRYHIQSFLTQELALVASRFHALDFYDKPLFDTIEQLTIKHTGRFFTNDAIATLAAFTHFDAGNKHIREILKSHIKEQHEYLNDDDYSERVRSSKLNMEDKTDLLSVLCRGDC